MDAAVAALLNNYGERYAHALGGVAHGAWGDGCVGLWQAIEGAARCRLCQRQIAHADKVAYGDDVVTVKVGLVELKLLVRQVEQIVKDANHVGGGDGAVIIDIAHEHSHIGIVEVSH